MQICIAYLSHQVSQQKQPNWFIIAKKYWRRTENATESRVTKKNKNKSHLNYAQYKRRRHVSDMPLLRPWGFPWHPPGLTYWLFGLGTEESRPSSIFVLFFFIKKKALILLSGSESHILQSVQMRWEGGILGNRRGRRKRSRRREQQSSCVLYWYWEFKTVCLNVILHSSKEQ